jgi:thiamine-monophosphate kinase
LSSPGNPPVTNHASRISDTGERALIERIRRRLPAAPRELVIGIGDDAAVAAPDRGALQVLTTDALVEGVHFDRRFSTPSDIGYKALAVNISDVAAMGGTSRFALLSLMLPAETTVDDIDGLLDGLLGLAGQTRVTLAGGNITRSPGPLVLDVTVIGSVKPRKILTRGGGRAGDALYVTGRIGAAAAGLGWLRAEAERRQEGSIIPRPVGTVQEECVARYCRPEPRARIGALLGRTRAASACMDLSDGLADAVTQLANASGTGATIDALLLPIHPGAASWFTAAGEDAVAACMAGGDDYELLFAVPRRTRTRLRGVLYESRGVPITRIGQLTPERTIGLARGGQVEPLPRGFVHF